MTDPTNIRSTPIYPQTSWVCSIRPTANGHRFFLHHTGRWAVADNSGAWPDCTDDGPLWLDPTRDVHYNPLGCSVPVTKTVGALNAPHYVGVTRTDAMFAAALMRKTLTMELN